MLGIVILMKQVILFHKALNLIFFIRIILFPVFLAHRAFRFKVRRGVILGCDRGVHLIDLLRKAQNIFILLLFLEFIVFLCDLQKLGRNAFNLHFLLVNGGLVLLNLLVIPVLLARRRLFLRLHFSLQLLYNLVQLLDFPLKSLDDPFLIGAALVVKT